MKLTHIRIKDFRSFADEHRFDVTGGVNYFVGPNNSGKSNLVRAVQLALEPDALFVPDVDTPSRDRSGGGAPRKTRITLTFQLGKSGPEKTLQNRAEAYEQGIRRARGTEGGSTYASQGELRFNTEFTPSGARVTSFLAKGQGAASLPASSEEHNKLIEQFRSVVRFAVIHSGEDLATLLAGKFREILHLVISDHLKDEMIAAEKAREEYLNALQSQLLEPLRLQIQGQVSGLFPEISSATLVPAVPTVSETLSSVDVRLGDIVTTALADKGTGIRGAVLVSMLQYLAEQSRRSLVLAVEEPEAFLHPAAQERTRFDLERLAARTDISLLVTTHSPYVISRTPSSLVTELHKNAEGISESLDAQRGDEPRATLLSSLYRDSGLSHLLEGALSVPPSAKAVVITEGYTDGLFIAACCKAAGRADLTDDIYFLPAGSAAKVVTQAILTRAATATPVIALLDFDENGKDAVKKLSAFNWEKSKGILSLSSWPDKCRYDSHDLEIEDLLPRPVVDRLVARLGEDAAVDAKVNCPQGSWHLSLSKAWKELAIKALEKELAREAAPEGGMVWLAEAILSRASVMAQGAKART